MHFVHHRHEMVILHLLERHRKHPPMRDRDHKCFFDHSFCLPSNSPADIRSTIFLFSIIVPFGTLRNLCQYWPFFLVKREFGNLSGCASKNPRHTADPTFSFPVKQWHVNTSFGSSFRYFRDSAAALSRAFGLYKQPSHFFSRTMTIWLINPLHRPIWYFVLGAH